MFLQQFLRGQGKTSIYAFLGFLNAFLTVVSIGVALIFFNQDLESVLWAMIIGQGVSLAVVIIASKIYLFIDLKLFSFTAFNKLITYSWPLVPNAISWWLIDLGNRYIILFYLGESFNGTYAIAARYAGIIALVNSIFILSWQDRLISMDISSAEEEAKEMSKIFNLFMVFELSLVVFLSAISFYLIRYTTAGIVHDSHYYLPILLISSMMASFSAFLGAYYLKLKRTKSILFSTLLGGIVNIIFCILFVRQFKLYAISIGSLLGFTTMFLYRAIDFRTITKNFNYGLFLILMLADVLIIWSKVFENSWVNMTLIFISTLLFFWLNKELILQIIKKLKLEVRSI